MAAAQSPQSVDEFFPVTELQQNEQYVYGRQPRSLRDGLVLRGRDRADSRSTTAGIGIAMTPPLHAALTNLTSGSWPSNAPEQATNHVHLVGSPSPSHPYLCHPSPLPRPRRLTLDVGTERPPLSLYPSPRPLPADHDFAILPDEDLSFIPLLDATSGSRPPASILAGPDDVTPRVQRRLTPMSFSDDMLMRHLRDSYAACDEEDAVDAVVGRHPSAHASAHVFGDVARRSADVDTSTPFADFAAYERESYLSTTFEVYELADDASARKMSLDLVDGPASTLRHSAEGPSHEMTADGIVDAPTVWEAIKRVNADGEAVGRITIVQEPTPLILAALHLTMSPHFDMAELLGHLLSEGPNRGRTHAFMHRAFEPPSSTIPYPPCHHHHTTPSLDTTASPTPPTPPASTFVHLRQRSFFFVFKYYTSVGEGLEPAPWQRFDKRPIHKRLGDHIDIADCSSVLALSLGGDPTKPLRMRHRRERAKEGFLFDTFGPWHLLSIQSFPDDQHTVRGEDFQRKSFYNGPYAFLDLLTSEYRDAGKRNQILHDRITKLITPPTEFMFDRRLRDKLLFEDKHFTYIRRYFWAYNTLAVINTGIKAMIAAYVDTFTDDFWAGTHPLLWPHPSPTCAEGQAYRDKMALLRRELDKVVAELGEVLKRNERTRKEIENLRDQLFSGSSIKESRRAIDQGDNIQILTTISMVFLPLTFVTVSPRAASSRLSPARYSTVEGKPLLTCSQSVFGITQFTIPATDWRFPLTMVLVCVPFMLVVLHFQTRSFTVLSRALHAAATYIASRFRDHQPSLPSPTGPPSALPASRSTAGRKRRLLAEAGGRAAGNPGRWRWLWPKKRVGEAGAGGGEDMDLAKV
ncbi:hypothetical protein DCS_06753 [Drechmeria coniospora]|uniref:GTPase-activator protein for Ras-like GTPase containing protein n=1 Tax=Drechmeria coniospora TaxID=98403 RepID=A0A151GCK0_DRECN|nr:hypothetical protein DCS_06753 [Drechmeria coniospora]KYK54793.1 hypothetical protein DCS_06753 [Drechmeria coniospora]